MSVAIAPLSSGQPASAQPDAFLSAPILERDHQLLILDTSDDTYRAAVRLTDLHLGYPVIAFSDRADRVFMAPTGAARIELLALEQPPRRGTLPLTATASWIDALPDGSKAYVSHNTGLDVVDFESGETTFVLQEAGGRAQGVAVNSTGDRVYVAVSGAPSALVAIDPVLDQPVERWELPGASESVLGAVVHPDDSRVYIADFSGAAVLVVDALTGDLLANITVAGAARAPTLTPSGDRLFVTTVLGLAVIDTATNEVIDTLLPGTFTTAVDVHPDGSRVYVVDLQGELSIFSTDSFELIKTLPTGFLDTLRSREFIAPFAG